MASDETLLMNSTTTISSTTQGPSVEDESFNYAKLTFQLIILVIGVVGNLISIFVIVVLKEYKKSVVNMYVLQLAIADVAFLLTIPFKIDEDIHKRWTFADWMCTAKETILYLNYNASILFLIVMSIDRYIAVCHTFSDKLSKFRKNRSAVIIIGVVWTLALLFCIPVMTNTNNRGIEPTCTCQFSFPNPKMKLDCSKLLNAVNNKKDYDECVRQENKEAAEGEKHCVLFSDLLSEYNYLTDYENLNYTDIYGYSDYDYSNSHSANMSGSESGTANTSESPNILATVNEERKDLVSSKCNYHGSPNAWYHFLYVNFIFLYLLPIIVMSISYGLIIRKVISSKMRSGSRSTTRDNQTVSIRNRVTIMSALIVSSFTLCWLPFHVVHLAKIRGINLPYDKGYVCENLAIFGTFLAYINSLLNPIFYSFFGTNFGKRFSSARKRAAKGLGLSSKRERGNKKRLNKNESSNDGTKATLVSRKSKSTMDNSQSQVSTKM